MAVKKIVITGGLGYIGTELAKLYSGEARYKKIVVTDNKFMSERVKQLRDWGIEFIQASILDEQKIAEVLKDADVVHHLAGITDVAYTKTESNTEKDNEIKKTAIDGTLNVLKYIPSHCKIIFPSTHVVFEGFSEVKLDIEETEIPTPVLTYSQCKYQNELDIMQSGKNYVILRLGSVYGYSADSTRIGIMPNLFSKMASQDVPLKLFGKGVQLKSLVSLHDVVRCFKFMDDANLTNEIFHLTNENLSVKDVAELIKEVKSNTELIETDDEIPNVGYTLSNKKLLSVGFTFQNNIKTAIKEMVTNWSSKEQPSRLEYIVRGGDEFIDSRGKISNYELTEPINLIGYIESTAGTVRANHYHPIQEQKCLLIKGQYISVIKDLSVPNAKIETQVINEGDLSVIRPNVAHTMVFTKDSIFLNLVRGERKHENYGVTHTIPYLLVDEEFKNDLLTHYKTTDRISGTTNIKPVLSLGLSPLANNLLNSVDEPCELFPLEMMYGPETHNCQLSYSVPSEKMFKHYLYVSSTSKSFRDHFNTAAQSYITEFNLNENSFVVDVGSNDGIALRPFVEHNIKVLGVEPAENISVLANKDGINTICAFFNEKVADKIVDEHGLADVITASNVFAHADNLEEIANASFKTLKEDGVFIIEVQYLLSMLKDLTFDNIYHEHFNYWTVTSLNNFFTKLGYVLYKAEYINTHGGSIRVYVKKTPVQVHESVSKFLLDEESFGIRKYETYVDFANKIEEVRKNVFTNVLQLKEQGLKIVGYGAPAKATTALNYFGLTSEHISYIIEDNSLKHGKFVPGVKIPIYSKDKLLEDKPDVILVLAWNFFEEIKKNNFELIEKGIRFINIKELM